MPLMAIEVLKVYIIKQPAGGEILPMVDHDEHHLFWCQFKCFAEKATKISGQGIEVRVA